jgi:hypothetical protein
VVAAMPSADYVFNPRYRLKSLPEVAAYIAKNHHLLDVPSEAEVRDKGVSVGQMQAKLLAKVEELTLHQIALQEQNEKLQRRLARLEARSENGGALK